MDNLVRARSLVGVSAGRPADDFYPTPAPAVAALLARFDPGPRVWEPACGDGAIARVLVETGREVVASDLYDHGYGAVGLDFLATTTPAAPVIVTNPPFRLADAFVEHAHALGVRRMAFLCKLAFLEGQKRSRMLEETGLSRVLVFRKRLALARGGGPAQSGMIAFAWFVWDGDRTGAPVVGWL